MVSLCNVRHCQLHARCLPQEELRPGRTLHTLSSAVLIAQPF